MLDKPLKANTFIGLVSRNICIAIYFVLCYWNSKITFILRQVKNSYANYRHSEGQAFFLYISAILKELLDRYRGVMELCGF